jgi:hypothetical protein
MRHNFGIRSVADIIAADPFRVGAEQCQRCLLIATKMICRRERGDVPKGDITLARLSENNEAAN